MSNPYNNAQRAILSIILNYGDPAFVIANRYLEERHFTELKYKMMWRCMKWLYDNAHEISEITTENSMTVTRDSTGQVAFDLLDPHNGRHKDELLAIKDYRKNETISHLQSYIDIMLDKFKVEKYFLMGEEIRRLSKGGKATAGQLQSIVNKYAEFFSEKDRKQPRTLIDAANTLIEKNRASEDGDQSIIQTGIPMLDGFIWLSQGNQTIIAGDTGHGKTSLALQIAWNVAKQLKKVVNPDTGRPLLSDEGKELWTHRRVLFLSLEMSESELLTKLCCIENNITVQKFVTELKPKEKVAMLDSFKGKISFVAPYFMVDYNVTNLHDIETKANMVASSYGGIDIVIVDYLQLVEDVKDRPFGRDDEVYRAVSRFLKKLAMRLETHTIALSQLNKPKMDKTGAVIHRPNLDRLFGSSALKQDATHVIFVYREWALEIKKTIINKEACSSYYINRLIIGKHRFGYNAIEIAVGFVPYISYFVPLQQIRDNNLLHSYDPSAVFPKIKDFAEKTN
jgi:replicative DNA helicase